MGQLEKKPVEQDIENILTYYWENFSRLFPEVSQSQFLDWINEDTYGGWEETQTMMAAGRRELKMLYATVRATKPKNILEIGTWNGVSTDHILLAAENNKKEGFECSVTTLDIGEYVRGRKLHNYPLNRVIQDSLQYLQLNQHFDFIMQDGNHTPAYVDKELKTFATFPNLKTVWSHDYWLRAGTLLKPVFDQNLNMWSNYSDFRDTNYSAGFHIGII